MSSYGLQYRGLPAEIRMMIWKLVIPDTINFTPRDHVEGSNGRLVQRYHPNDGRRIRHEANLRRRAGFQEGVVLHDTDWDGHKADRVPNLTSYNNNTMRLNQETRIETWDLFNFRATFDFSGVQDTDDDLLHQLLSSLAPGVHRMAREMIIRRGVRYLNRRRDVRPLLSQFRLQRLTILIDPFGRDELLHSTKARRPITHWTAARSLDSLRYFWDVRDTAAFLTLIRDCQIEAVELLVTDSYRVISQAVNPRGRDAWGIASWIDAWYRLVDWTFSEGIIGSDSFSTVNVAPSKRFHAAIMGRFSGCEACVITLKARQKARQ